MSAPAPQTHGTPEPVPSTSFALPAQPTDVVWPTMAWATGEQLSGDPDRVEALLDAPFLTGTSGELGLSLAFIAVQGGRVVAERYGPSASSTTPLISWSTAKSITHAALGILVGDGLVDPAAPLAAPEWSGPGDPRAAITWNDLLAMRSGLHFNEDYVDAEESNCIEMLFGSGADDVASYAAGLPLEQPVDAVYNYSSGTTNLITRAMADVLHAHSGGDPSDPAARRDVMERFLRDRIFDPIGMTSADPRFDAAGTFVGSSYVYATARDFARFGLLYLRNGVWDGERLLPEGWVDDARTIRSVDPDDGRLYGHHWWVRGDRHGTFWANGYEKQLIVCVPALDLVIVRLGKTSADQADAFQSFWHGIIDAFAD